MAEDKQKRNARQNRWKANNKDRINVMFEKGTKERVAAAANKLGETSGEFIRKAVERRLTETEKS